MYLLDTNICIYAINNRNENLLKAIYAKSKKGILISSLTVAELEYGVENSQHIEKNRVAMLKFLTLFKVLNFTDSDAVQYGKLKARLKKMGNIIGPIDMLIAAQGLSNGLILVTNNVKEFSRINGLKIEDWSKAEAK
jgi:tRNA(fMet)-specific endonuclease VapC